MDRGCDKMIVLGRLCGDALFLFALFAERSMPVPYIGDPDIKISDHHRSPTTRILLDCRQLPHYDSLPAGAPGKKTPDPHPGSTHRVLLDCRQAPCTTVWVRALPGENDPWRFRQQSSRVISIQFWYLTSWLPRFLLCQTRPSYSIVELLPFSIPLLSFLRKCILSEEKRKDRLSIPFFIGIFGELDHWYHLFVVI